MVGFRDTSALHKFRLLGIIDSPLNVQSGHMRCQQCILSKCDCRYLYITSTLFVPHFLLDVLTFYGCPSMSQVADENCIKTVVSQYNVLTMSILRWRYVMSI